MDEWSAAVRHIKFMMGVIAAMYWSLPVAAWAWMRFRRRGDRSASVLFGKVLLWSWLVLILGLVAFFFSGAWYSEGGHPPDDVPVVNVIVGIFTATYVSLVVTLRPSTGHGKAADAARPFLVFAGVAVITTIGALLFA